LLIKILQDDTRRRAYPAPALVCILRFTPRWRACLPLRSSHSKHRTRWKHAISKYEPISSKLSFLKRIEWNAHRTRTSANLIRCFLPFDKEAPGRWTAERGFRSGVEVRK